MVFSTVLARLRKKCGLTQVEVANHISMNTEKGCSFKIVSNWENGVSMPSAEQFLLLCELYGVQDIQDTFSGKKTEFRGLPKLNKLGKSRVEEYIAVLSGNPLYAGIEGAGYYAGQRRIIRLYDAPAAVGTGSFINCGAYENFEVDKTVPREADFAVKISGDSMAPRFVDGQIVFIKEQQALDIGDIGVFELDGDAYIKKLGHSELLSLNPLYEPIKIFYDSSFHIFGKVLG